MSNPIDPATNPDRACRDVPTDTFFPPGTDSKTAAAESRLVAKTYCAACPVVAECLEWALWVEGKTGRHSRAGIYGGKTPMQRAQIATSRRKGGTDESKVCEGCGQLFFRREDDGPRMWAGRRFHSQSCANRVSEAKRRAARDVA